MAATDPLPHSPGRRVVVIGTSGSGKTTLAGRLATQLNIPHIELDALHWGPNWSEDTPAAFRARVATALQGETWIVDGNYSRVRDLVWSRADTVVWLDYSLPVIMSRLFRRSLRRLLTREELWNNNREIWRTTFLSRESILWWALRTYRRRRREYPVLLAQPEHAHLTVVHLRSPRAAEEWLASIGKGAQSAGSAPG